MIGKLRRVMRSFERVLQIPHAQPPAVYVPLQPGCESPLLSAIEVHFTPEQEARILQIANYNCTAAEQFVKQAALRLVEEDEHFRADIDEAIEQADRGQLMTMKKSKRALPVFAASMIVRWTEYAFLSHQQISKSRCRR